MQELETLRRELEDLYVELMAEADKLDPTLALMHRSEAAGINRALRLVDAAIARLAQVEQRDGDDDER